MSNIYERENVGNRKGRTVVGNETYKDSAWNENAFTDERFKKSILLRSRKKEEMEFLRDMNKKVLRGVMKNYLKQNNIKDFGYSQIKEALGTKGYSSWTQGIIIELTTELIEEGWFGFGEDNRLVMLKVKKKSKNKTEPKVSEETSKDKEDPKKPESEPVNPFQDLVDAINDGGVFKIVDMLTNGVKFPKQ